MCRVEPYSAPWAILLLIHILWREKRSWLFFFYSSPVIGCRFYMRIITSITSYCVKLSIYWIHMWIENSSRGLPNCYNTFTLSFPILYADRYTSCNMHQILHLPSVVEILEDTISLKWASVFVCFSFIIILNYSSPWTWPWHSIIG